MTANRRKYSSISTCFLFSIEVVLADIEVSITSGLPNFEITGFAFGKLAPIIAELELSGKIMERGRRYALTFLCT